MSNAVENPDGRFEPPAGCNDNPQPWQLFSSLGYLLPKSTATGPFVGDLSTTSRFGDRTTTDDTSRKGDAQSQSGVRPRPPTTASQAESPSQRQDSGEYMLQLSPKFTWKPYKGWEDSRHKYKVVRTSCAKGPQKHALGWLLHVACRDLVRCVALRRRR